MANFFVPSHLQNLYDDSGSLSTEKKKSVLKSSAQKKEALSPGWAQQQYNDALRNDADGYAGSRLGTEEANGFSIDALETSDYRYIDPKTGQPRNTPQSIQSLNNQKEMVGERLGMDAEDVTLDDIKAQGKKDTIFASDLLLEGQENYFKDGTTEGPVRPNETESGMPLVDVFDTGRFTKGGKPRPVKDFRNPITGKVLSEALNNPEMNVNFESDRYNAKGQAAYNETPAGKEKILEGTDRTTGEVIGDIGAGLSKFGVNTGATAYGVADVTARTLMNPVNALASQIDKVLPEWLKTGKTLGQSTDRPEFARTNKIIDDSMMSEQTKLSQRKMSAQMDKHNEGAEERKSKWIKDKTFTPLGAEVADMVMSIGEGAKAGIDNPLALQDVLVTSAPQLVTGGIFGKAAVNKVLANKTAGMTEKQLQNFVGSKAGKNLIDKTATRTGIASEAIQESMINATHKQEEVLNMSEKELSESSEYYQALRTNGLSHEQARTKAANNVFNTTAAITAVISSGASKGFGTGKASGKLLLNNDGLPAGAIKKGVDAVTKTGKNIIGEGGQEIIQEGGGELAGNIAEKAFIDDEKSITEGVGTSAGLGGLAGTATAGGIHGLSNTAKATGMGIKKTAETVEKVAPKVKEAAAKVKEKVSPNKTLKNINKSFTKIDEINNNKDLSTEEKQSQFMSAMQETNELIKNRGNLSSKDTKAVTEQFQAYQDQLFGVETQDAKETATEKPEDLTDKQGTTVAKDIINNGGTDTFSNEELAAFEQNPETNEIVNFAKTFVSDINAYSESENKTYQQVVNEVMGAGTNNTSKKGVQQHVMDTMDSLLANNQEATQANLDQLQTFATSQANKLAEFEAGIASGKEYQVGGKTYNPTSDSATYRGDKIINQVKQESAILNKSLNTLQNISNKKFASDTTTDMSVTPSDTQVTSDINPPPATSEDYGNMDSAPDMEVDSTGPQNPVTATDLENKVSSDIIQANTIGEATTAVNDYYEAKGDPVSKAKQSLLNKIKSFINPDAKLSNVKFEEGSKTAATYTAQTDEYTVTTKEGDIPQKTLIADGLLHEAVHGATVHKILNQDTLTESEKDAVNNVRSIGNELLASLEAGDTKEDKELTKLLNKLLNIQKTKGDEHFIAEVVTYGLTKDALINHLKSKPSLYKEFINAISKILGLSTEETNAFEDLLAEAEVLMGSKAEVESKKQPKTSVLDNLTYRKDGVLHTPKKSPQKQAKTETKATTPDTDITQKKEAEKEPEAPEIDSHKEVFGTIMDEAIVPPENMNKSGSIDYSDAILKAVQPLKKLISFIANKSPLSQGISTAFTKQNQKEKFYTKLVTQISNYNPMQGGDGVIRQGDLKDIDYINSPINYFLNDEGKLPQTVIDAMGQASLKWAGTDSADTWMNDARSIQTILGLDSKETPSDEAVSTLFNAGSPMKNVTSKIGNDVIATLGIKPKGDVDSLFMQRLANSIGMLAITSMSNTIIDGQPLAVINEIHNDYLNYLGDKPVKDAVGSTYFVRMGNDSNGDKSPVFTAMSDYYKANKEGFKSIFSTREDKTVSTEPVTEVVNSVKGAVTVPPETMRKNLKVAQAVPHKFKDNHLKLFDSMNEFAFLQTMGYMPEAELKRLPIDQQAGVEAKNKLLQEEAQKVKEFRETYKDDQEFFYKYSVWQLMRNGIESNEINYQLSKIHRHLSSADNVEQVIRLDSDKDKAYLLDAVMQGLGYPVDKQLSDEIVKQFSKDVFDGKFKDIVYEAAVDAINKSLEGKKLSDSDNQAIIDATNQAGENAYSFDSLLALTQYINAVKSGKKDITINIPHETDGVTNGFAGLILQFGVSDVELRNAVGIYNSNQEDNNLLEYKSNPNTKSDDLYEITVAGMGAFIDGLTEDGGFLDTKGVAPGLPGLTVGSEQIVDPEKVFNQSTSKDGPTLSQEQIGAKLSALHEITGKLNERQKGKDVVLKFGYGAGNTSITNSSIREIFGKLQRNIVEKSYAFQEASKEDKPVLLKEIKNILDAVSELSNSNTVYGSKNESLINIFNQYYMAGNINEIFSEKFFREFNKGTSQKKDSVEVLMESLKNVYGAAVRDSVETKFSEIIEAQQEMLELSNMSNLIAVAIENSTINKLEESTGQVLSAKELKEVQQGLIKDGLAFTVKGQMSERDDNMDSLHIFKKDTTKVPAEKGGQSSIKYKKSGTFKVNTIKYNPNMPGNKEEVYGRESNSVNTSILQDTKSYEEGVKAIPMGNISQDGNTASKAILGAKNDSAFDATLRNPADVASDRLLNEVWYEDGMSWNMVGEFENTAKRLASEYNSLDKDTKDIIVNEFMKKENKYKKDEDKVDFDGAKNLFEDKLMDIKRNNIGDRTQAKKDVMNLLSSNVAQYSSWEEGTYNKTKKQITKQNKELAVLGNIAAGIRGAAEKAYMKEKPFMVEAYENIRMNTDNFKGSDATHFNGADYITSAPQTVNASTSKQVFNDLGLNKSTTDSKQHTEYLLNLMDNVVNPALKMVDDFVLKVNSDSTNKINRGFQDNKNIYVNTSDMILDGNMDMSGQEVFAHEMTHGIWETVIDNDLYTRTEVEKLYELAKKGFSKKAKELGIHPSELLLQTDMKGNVIVPKNSTLQAEKDKAQARYEYIFENPNGKGYLHEFAAIGLTNEQFINGLSRLDASPAQIPYEGSMFNKLGALWSNAVNWIGSVVHGTRGKKINQALYSLAQQTTANNNKGQARAQAYSQTLGRLNFATQNFINEKAIKPYMDYFDERYSGDTSKLNKQVMFATLGLPYYIGSGEFHTELQKVLRDGFNLTKNNPVYKLLREFAGTQIKDLPFLKLLREQRQHVETQKVNIAASVTKQLNQSFDPKDAMTDDKWMALNNGMLKTDISSIWNQYGKGVTKFFTKKARMERINKLEGEFKKNHPDTYLRVSQQLESLGNYMATGQVLLRQQILSIKPLLANTLQDDMGNLYEATEAEINAAEELATLWAIDATDQSVLDTTKNIINNEFSRDIEVENGIQELMNLHQLFKQESKEKNFKGNEDLMIKGYTKEKYDPYRSMVVATLDEESALKAQGYTKMEVVPKDKSDPNQVDNYIYISKDGGLNEYMSGIFSNLSKQAKGTDIIQIYKEAGYKTPVSMGKNAVNRVAKKSASDFNKQKTERLINKDETYLVPSVNNSGQLTNYRYMMKEKNKVKYMGKKDLANEVLGKMFGDVIEKEKGFEFNKKLLSTLKTDYNLFHKSNPRDFIYISPHSTDKKHREYFAMLNDETRKELYKHFPAKGGKQGFYVREDLADLVFGYRKASLSMWLGDATGMPAQMKHLMKLSGRLWQAVVSKAKRNVVVLTPQVVTANNISNVILLMLKGIDPVTAIKQMNVALKGIIHYENNYNKSLLLKRRIKVEKDANKKDKLNIRLKQLEDNMAKNPVAGLLEAGVFQTIAEDINNQNDKLVDIAVSYSDKLGLGVDKLAGKTPAFIKEGYKQAVIEPDTETGELLARTTQYSDFLARYALYEHLTKNNGVPKEEALQETIDTFINYDVPTSKEMQWLNDMGLFMYTKFFFRIQKIILSAVYKNPVNAASLEIMQQAIIDMPDIVDSNIIASGIMSRFNPEILEDAFQINALNFVPLADL